MRRGRGAFDGVRRMSSDCGDSDEECGDCAVEGVVGSVTRSMAADAETRAKKMQRLEIDSAGKVDASKASSSLGFVEARFRGESDISCSIKKKRNSAVRMIFRQGVHRNAHICIMTRADDHRSEIHKNVARAPRFRDVHLNNGLSGCGLFDSTRRG
eukprot:IDg15925t1